MAQYIWISPSSTGSHGQRCCSSPRVVVEHAPCSRESKRSRTDEGEGYVSADEEGLELLKEVVGL